MIDFTSSGSLYAIGKIVLMAKTYSLWTRLGMRPCSSTARQLSIGGMVVASREEGTGAGIFRGGTKAWDFRNYTGALKVVFPATAGHWLQMLLKTANAQGLE